MDPVLSSTIASSSVLCGRRSAELLAETVASSGSDVEPEPDPDPEPVPVVFVPKMTGASSGMEPDAESLMVCPVDGKPAYRRLEIRIGHGEVQIAGRHVAVVERPRVSLPCRRILARRILIVREIDARGNRRYVERHLHARLRHLVVDHVQRRAHGADHEARADGEDHRDGARVACHQGRDGPAACSGAGEHACIDGSVHELFWSHGAVSLQESA